jgi:hypothetical protein
MKKFLILTICLFSLNHLSGQEYAADRGAFIVGGTAGFTSSGGQLYEAMGKRTTHISLIPSVDYFPVRNLFIGGVLQYSGSKEGDSNIYSFGIGPDIGYVFANPESKILPLISVGYLYSKTNYDVIDMYFPSTSASEFMFGAGVIVPVQKHIGVTFGAVYHQQKIKTQSGNVFALTLGIDGLLYKAPK